MRRIDRHAEPCAGLAQPAALQVEHAFQRLGVHAVEGAVALPAARLVEQALRLVLVADHRNDVGHGVEQRTVGKGQAGRQARKAFATGFIGFVVAVLHGQQQREQRVSTGAHFRNAALGAAGLLQLLHCIPRPVGEAVGPQGDQLQHRMRTQLVLRNGREPAREHPHAALFQEMLGMPVEQHQRVRVIAAFDGMVDGRHRPPLRLVPACRREMEACDIVRPLMDQLRPQEIGEQAVITPGGRIAAGDGRDEQVGRSQPVEDGHAIGTRIQRLAHRGIELAQDAGAQQEVANLPGLVGQHVFGQVIGHRTVRPRKALHKTGFQSVPFQGHRRQPDRRHPALGLAMQLVQHVDGQRLADTLAEEGAGFFQVEAQAVGVDLDQLTACAQAAQAQVGQPARADDDLAPVRQVIDDFAHQAQHGGFLDHLEVVEKQGERGRVLGECRHGVEVRVGRRVMDTQAPHGFAQAAQETRHVVVDTVQREPAGGHAIGFHPLATLGHRSGLAEACGGTHQDQLDTCRPDLLADGRAQHLRDDGRRRIQLGFEDAGRRSGCHFGQRGMRRAMNRGQRRTSGAVLNTAAGGETARLPGCHPCDTVQGIPSFPTMFLFDCAF